VTVETTEAPRQRPRILREVLLWGFAVLGTLCILVTLAAVLFGSTLLIFRSGSMSPTVSTGSLALTVNTQARDLVPGDIISVVWADGTRVTHRLESVEQANGELYTLTTKGDANKETDKEKVTVTSVDRVVWHVPQLGFAFENGTKPQYVFAVGVGVGALLVFAFRPGGRPPAKAPARRAAATENRGSKGRRSAGTAASVTALALTASLLAAPGPTGTMALFNDSGAARGTFATGSLAAPTITGCTVTGLLSATLTLTWTQPATGIAQTGFRIDLTRTGGITTSFTAAAGDRTKAIASGDLGVLAAYTVVIYSTRNSWQRASTNTASAAVLLSPLGGCTIA
jgi:signal peptidase I